MSRYYKHLLLLATILLGIFVITLPLPYGLRAIVLRENGIVENATIFGYIVCIFLIFQKGGADWIKAQWQLTAWILLLFSREADMHSRFTAHSIFSTKLYIDINTSTPTLVISTTVVLILMCLFSYTIWKYSKVFFTQQLKRIDHALFTAIALLFAVIAKFLDGISRTLSRFSISINRDIELLFMQIEETIELGIPLALCLATISYFSDFRKPTQHQNIHSSYS
jgi:hypothetical protein